MLIPIGNLLIVFKEGVKDMPTSFYAWTINSEGNLTPMKYMSCSNDIADSLVEL